MVKTLYQTTENTGTANDSTNTQHKAPSSHPVLWFKSISFLINLYPFNKCFLYLYSASHLSSHILLLCYSKLPSISSFVSLCYKIPDTFHTISTVNLKLHTNQFSNTVNPLTKSPTVNSSPCYPLHINSIQQHLQVAVSILLVRRSGCDSWKRMLLKCSTTMVFTYHIS